MNRRTLLLSALAFLVSLAGCSSPTETPEVPTASLVPFLPPEPTLTVEPPQPRPTVAPEIGPSPTPFTHQVQKDDTLLGIAIKYGVSLDELLTANPGINPRILSIGQEIIIPGPEGEPSGAFLPTATPVPLDLSTVQCFQTPAESAWCVVSVRNGGENVLEGLSVMITFVDEDGEAVVSLPAYGPLNLLPMGHTMPLGVNAQLPEYAYALVQPLTAFYGEGVEERYLELELTWEAVQQSDDGRSWEMRGTLAAIGEGEREAETAAILAVAFDEEGRVVGFRKWEAERPLHQGDILEFNVEVFSLGPVIDRVELFAEALETSSG